MMYNDMEDLYGAAGILDLFPDRQDVDAFVVDTSNPVCPCCGAKLILNDGKTAAETDSLASGQIQESYVKDDDVLPLVHDTAEDIVDAYFEDESADTKELIVITDSRLKNAIRRKAIELQSILEMNYEIKIPLELLIAYIKNDIKDIVARYK